MMKKLLSVITALALLACACTAALAESGDAGTVEMAQAGMRFTPPAEYASAKGQIVTDGAIQYNESIYYAYWVYVPVTEYELQEMLQSGTVDSAPLCDLCYLFSIGDGWTFDDFNSMVDHVFDPANVTMTGQAGDRTFYLYTEPVNPEFAETIDPEYREDYLQAAGLGATLAERMECFDPYDPMVGRKIEFTTKDLDGNVITSAELFARSEITMLNIWATWCPPCIRELPELQQIHQRMQEKGCAIVGLLYDNKPEEARRLMAENGVAYTVIHAPDNVDGLFRIPGYPTSYFIDRNGVIVAPAITGAYTEKYEQTLNGLLAPRE